MNEHPKPQTPPAFKYCRESRVFKTGRVFPNDVNNHKTLFGGKLMSSIDEVASISAMRHCRANVVTASADSVDFLLPIRPTDSVCFESFVSWTGRTSIEVFVKIISEHLYTGERAVAATSFLTFVAVGDDGEPHQVPGIIPETPEEKLINESAQERAELRKVRRTMSKTLASQLNTSKYWENYSSGD
ncbi:acyl-CoA thioesterase [Paenibacillus sp. sgz500958]|uniref:acyl-CoA thioesterase n=1 Tax=Paenibacillus sp. sgz500958 TaxID=3242475 RepID=UPI0036D298F4